MTVAIRKVLPEEVAELKVISEDTFRETFAHDNTEAQLQGYFDTALSEEVLLDEITHEESRYFFILVDGEKGRFSKDQCRFRSNRAAFGQCLSNSTDLYQSGLPRHGLG